MLMFLLFSDQILGGGKGLLRWADCLRVALPVEESQHLVPKSRKIPMKNDETRQEEILHTFRVIYFSAVRLDRLI